MKIVMSTKARIFSLSATIFLSSMFLLFCLGRLEASRTVPHQPPYTLWFTIIFTGLFLTTLALIYNEYKRYDLLLEKKNEQIEESTHSLLEIQTSLEESVERRTFELVVVNGSLHREIAERIQAETESKNLQKQLEIILDSAAEGIFGIDTNGNVTFINKTASRLLGWRQQDLIGNSHHDIVHHSHNDGSPYPISQCPIYQTYKEGSIHDCADETFWTKSGQSFPVEYTSTPIMENDTLNGAVVVFRDVSESNKLKKQLEMIVNSTGEGIFGLDSQGNVSFMNRAASIMLGWEIEDLIGKSHHTLVHHSHSDGSPYPEEKCPIYKAYKDGLVHYKSGDIFWTKTGESFPVEYTSTPIRENQQLVGAVVVFRDMNTFA